MFSTVITSTRQLPCDPDALTSAVRTAVADPAAVAAEGLIGIVAIAKTTDFSATDLQACQAAVDTAPAVTAEVLAQRTIDRMPIFEKAICLTLIDELNNLREWLVAFKAAVAASTSLANLQTRVAALPDMPDRTVQQAITAIRNKAGSL